MKVDFNINILHSYLYFDLYATFSKVTTWFEKQTFSLFIWSTSSTSRIISSKDKKLCWEKIWFLKCKTLRLEVISQGLNKQMQLKILARAGLTAGGSQDCAIEKHKFAIYSLYLFTSNVKFSFVNSVTTVTHFHGNY